MLVIIAFLSLLSSLIVLYFLAVTDLKVRLLPNELVLAFLALGMIFHLSTIYAYLNIEEMLLGGTAGAGLLYLIRFVANFFYKEDALGLGDVKLLGAAGVWLGPYYILIAMTLGALAGILHGLAFAIYKKLRTNTPFNLARLSVPAGPGFAVGIIVTGLYVFRNFPELFLS